MKQKLQNPQKVNIRHLTESQYKKHKNIPPQDHPKQCKPDYDLPQNLMMMPKPMVSLSNFQNQQQRQVTPTQQVNQITRGARTFSFSNTISTTQSLQFSNPLSKKPMLTTQLSSGNLHQQLQNTTQPHQRTNSCHSSTIISDNQIRNSINISTQHAQIVQQNEELISSNKEFRTQLIQERETSKELYETLQKAQVEIKNKENQMQNYIQQQRQELILNFEKEVQSYKEALLKQEKEITNLQQTQIKQNVMEFEKLEEKIVLLTTEIERMKLIINEKNQFNSKLEEKCAMFTQEIERLQLLAQRNINTQMQVQETTIHEIKQFEEKIFLYEQEKKQVISDVHMLSEENKHLNEINNKLEEKVAGFTTEIERLNYMLQSRQNAYEERIANLSVEIERLTSMLQSRSSTYEQSILQLNTEIQHLNNDIQHLNDVKNIQDTENTNTFNDLKNKYEEKIVKFTQEIQRLHEIIREKDLSIADGEEQIKRTKFSHKDIIDQERASFELIQGKQNHRILELENECQFAQVEIQRQQERINDAYLERDRAQSSELALNREIENLQEIYSSKVREVETLQERIRILERECEQRINEVKNHFELMKQSNISREVQELTIKFNNERKQLETQISNMVQTTKEQENNLQIITAETDRLRQLCDKKTQDIENLKQTELIQHNKIENLSMQIQNLTIELQESQKQYILIQEELQHQFERQKHIELEQLEREIKRDFLEQLGQLNTKLNESLIKNEDLLMKIVLTLTELERVKDQNEKLWEDNCILQQREKQIEIQFQEEFTQYKVDIEQANREKLEFELKEIYDKIDLQQQKYSVEINRLQTELKSSQETIQNLQLNITELENKIVLITTENNRILFINQEKDKQIQLQEIEFNKLKENTIQIENKLNLTLTENQALEQKNQNSSNLLMERDNTITSQQSDIQKYLVQIILITSTLESQGEEFEEIRKRNKILEEEVIPNYEQLLNKSKINTSIIIQEKSEHYEKVIQDNTIQFENMFTDLENRLKITLEKYIISCIELERQNEKINHLNSQLDQIQTNKLQTETHLQDQIQQLNSNLNEQMTYIQNFTDQQNLLREKYDNLDCNHQNLFDEYSKLSQSYNDLLQNFNYSQDEIKQLQDDLSQQQDRVKHSKKQNDEFQSQLQANLNNIEQQKLQLEKEKEVISNERDRLISCIQEIEKQYINLNENYRNLEQQNNELNQNIENILKQNKITEDSFFEEKQQLLTGFEQIQGFNSQLEEKIRELETVIRNLEDQVQDYQEQITTLQGQLQEREEQIKLLEGQLNEQERKINEQEGQIRDQEAFIRDQQEQIKDQEGFIKVFEGQIRDQKGYIRDIDTKNKEFEVKITDLQELNKDLKELNKDLQVKNENQEIELQDKDEEIKRASQQHGEIQDELENAKQQSNKQNEENEIRYQQQIQTFEVRFEETCYQFNQERIQFEKEIEGYENIIRMLENNIETLNFEKEELVKQAQERIKQLEEWRLKYNVGGCGDDIEKQLKEIEEQRQKIHELEDKLIQKTEINGNLQITINKYEKEVKLLEDEKNELLTMLESRKQENDKKSKEVQEMRDKIQQLNEQLRQLEADLIKKSEIFTHDTMKQSQMSSRNESGIKAKYHQMFARNPLEQKDSNNIKNKSLDLSSYSKLTTIVTSTQTQLSQFMDKENIGSSEEINDNTL